MRFEPHRPLLLFAVACTACSSGAPTDPQPKAARAERGLDPTLADLQVGSLDLSQLTVDPTNLAAGGVVNVVVENTGGGTTEANVELRLYEERDGLAGFDAAQDLLLGTASSGPLGPGGQVQRTLPIDATLAFVGSPIVAEVDPNGLVAESHEDNNRQGSHDDCAHTPTPGVFAPVLEWSWTGSLIQPTYDDVIMTPAVGDIDQDGIPDIVFNTRASHGSGSFAAGILRVISGEDGREIFEHLDDFTEAGSQVAIGDIDEDGLPEIIALITSFGGVIALESDGTVKWRSYHIHGGIGAPAIANVDGVGPPEIVVGTWVLNADGTVLTPGIGDAGGIGGAHGGVTCLADFDEDGDLEIAAGHRVLHHDGSVYFDGWDTPGAAAGLRAFCAVANFDADPRPELVAVGGGTVYLYDDDGTRLWSYADARLESRGGAPTVADFDADGVAEIGVAGHRVYLVLEHLGLSADEKWTADIQDHSSFATSSSVFDFDGDGEAEVVYNDERHLRILRGRDGIEIFRTPNPSCTLYENPVVADVDADGNAEIVVARNQLCGIAATLGIADQGIFVFGDSTDAWVSTRRVWNQHAYSVTHVRDDLTIPPVVTPNWTLPGLNSFRTQALPEAGALAAPDLQLSYLRRELGACPAILDLQVRMGNGGALLAPAGLRVDLEIDGALHQSAQTQTRLEPGQFEDLAFSVVPVPPGAHTLCFVADAAAAHNECDEPNNRHCIDFEDLCAPDPPPILPEITSTAITDATEDAAYLYDVASNIEGQPGASYTLINGPTGMQLEALQGTLTWLPADAQVGNHPVTIRLEDGQGNSTDQAFQITVAPFNDAPVLSFPERVVVIAADIVEPTTLFVLDDYVTDEEDAPSDITWSLTGGDAVSANLTPDRLLRIQAPGDRCDIRETLELTATDSGQGAAPAQVRSAGVELRVRPAPRPEKQQCVLDELAQRVLRVGPPGSAGVDFHSLGAALTQLAADPWVATSILLADGVYAERPRVENLPAHAGAPLSIAAERVGGAIFEGGECADGAVFAVVNTPFVSLLGLTVRGGNDAGLLIDNSASVTLCGVTTEDHAQEGLRCRNSSALLLSAVDSRDNGRAGLSLRPGCDGAAIEGGSALRNGSAGLRLLGVNDVSMSELTLNENTVGLRARGSHRLDARGVVTSYNQQAGIDLAGCDACALRRSAFAANGEFGALIANSEALTFEDNAISGHPIAGLKTWLSELTVANNRVEDNATGLHVDAGCEAALRGNLVKGSADRGIYLHRSAGAVIEGNTLDNGGGDGLHLGLRSRAAQVRENIFSNHAGVGVRVDASARPGVDHDDNLYFQNAGGDTFGVEPGLGARFEDPQLDADGRAAVGGPGEGRGYVPVDRCSNHVIANRPPRFDHGIPPVATEGAEYRAQLAASDPDADPLRFRLEEGPAGASLDTSSGLLRWRPDDTQAGAHPMLLSVVDGRGGRATLRAELEVREALNAAPVLLSAPNTVAIEGTPYQTVLVARDPEGGALRYEADVSELSGASFDATTGTLTWQPPCDAAAQSPYAVALFAVDATDARSEQRFSLRVDEGCNASPSLRVEGPFEAPEGQSTTLIFESTDPEGEALFAVWEQAPPFVSGVSPPLITPGPCDARVEPYFATLAVGDPAGALVREDFEFTVQEAADCPPQIDSPPPPTAWFGEDFVYAVTVSDTDPQPGESYFFSVIQGPAGLSIDPATGVVSWQPGPGDGGDHPLTLRAESSRGGSAEVSFTLQALAAPNARPTLTLPCAGAASEGLDYSCQASATDPDGEALTFSLRRAPAGMGLDAQSGLLSWRPGPADQGDYVVVVRATDPLGGSDTKHFALNVADRLNVRPRILSTPPAEVGVETQYSYTLQATDDDGDALQCLLSVAPAEASLADCTITWTPQREDVGRHAIALRVVDGRGGESAQIAEIEVPDPPAILSAPNLEAIVGLPYRSPLVVVAPATEPLWARLVNAPEWLSLGGLGRREGRPASLVGVPDPEDAGAVQVEVEISDRLGARVTQLFELQVRENAGPRLLPARCESEVRLGALWHCDLDVADPNGGDLHEASVPADAYPTTRVAALYEGLQPGVVSRWRLTLHANTYGPLLAALEVQDALGERVRFERAITVLDVDAPNRPPTLHWPEPAGTARAGERYEARFEATDPDGDPVDFLLEQGPPGAVLDSRSGQLHYEPGLADIGTHPVHIAADDRQGGRDRIEFLLSVVAPERDNQGPRFTCAPPALAESGLPYVAEICASDPDGDPLTFSLREAPDGASIDARIGQLRWTPEDTQLGVQSFSVEIRDGFGGYGRLDFPVEVFAPAADNDPPRFSSRPPLFAEVGTQWSYQPDVIDREGGAVEIRLEAGRHPAGMIVDAGLGGVLWTPDFPGDVPVGVLAVDPAGAETRQRFILRVREAGTANTAPTLAVQAAPPAVTTVGALWYGELSGNDVDGDGLSFSLDGAPAGATIDVESGQLRWTPAPEQLGAHNFDAVLQDGRGGEARLPLSVLVEAAGADIEAPQVEIAIEPAQPAVGEAMTVLLLASDDRGISSAALQADGAVVLLDEALSATLTFDTPGEHTLVAEVSDGTNTTETTRTLRVVDPTDFDAPEVDIRVPHVDEELEGTVRVQGTVLDDALEYWHLELCPRSGGDCARLAEGQENADDIDLVLFDASEHSQGFYDLELLGRDRSGQQSVLRRRVSLISNRTPTLSVADFGPQPLQPGHLMRGEVQAQDLDGDTVSWQAETAPDGMVVLDTLEAGVATGHAQVLWVPNAAQAGTHTVTLAATDNGTPPRTLRVTRTVVVAGEPNVAPIIRSEPSERASVGAPYRYRVVAEDPEDTALQFTLPAAPGGASVDANGLISWTPDAAQVGPVDFSLHVTDAGGQVAEQHWTTEVFPAVVGNTQPFFASAPTLTGREGDAWRYAAEVEDADGDRLSFSLTQGPLRMQVDAETGALFWRPGPRDAGVHAVVLLVADEQGGWAEQSFDLDIEAVDETPRIVTQPLLTVPDGFQYVHDADAEDPDGDAITWRVEGPAGMTVDADGVLLWNAFDPLNGPVPVSLFASDPAGNEGRQDFAIAVTGAPDTTAPELRIDTPEEDAVLSESVEITGRAWDAQLLGYTLEACPLRGNGLGACRLLRQGAAPVEDGLLGRINPRRFAAGSWLIRLRAEDATGNPAVVERRVVLDGIDDPAVLRMAFDDFLIETPRFDLILTRVYDGLDLSPGELGFGWRYELQLGHLEQLDLLHDRWESELRLGIPPVRTVRPTAGHRQRLFLRDGRRFDFEAAAEVDPFDYSSAPGVRVRFYPADGQDTQLLALDANRTPYCDCFDSLLMVGSRILDATSGEVFAPRYFEMRTPEGEHFLFGADGRPVGFTTPEGVNIEVDEGGVSADGAALIQFDRDLDGRVQRASDLATGTAVDYRFDALGDLVEVIDQDGDAEHYVYGPAHRMVAWTLPDARAARRVEYDAEGRVRRRSDPSGGSMTYDYDDGGRTVTMTDARGGTALVRYDANGRVIESVDSMGRRTTRSYDERGNAIRVVDALDRVVETDFDSFDRPVLYRNAVGDTRHIAYDPSGEVSSVTNEDGRTWSVRFDGHGRPTAWVLPSGTELRRFEYPDADSVVQIDPHGRRWLEQYDAQGRVVREVDPDGRETTVSFLEGPRRAEVTDDQGTTTVYRDRSGNMTGYDLPSGAEARLHFKAGGQLLGTTRPDGIEQRFERDRSGRMSAITVDGVPLKRFQHDALGRIVTERSADGAVTRRRYDEAGRQVAVESPQGTETFVYDVGDRLTEQQGPDGVVRFVYDSLDRPIEIDSDGGPVMRLEYNRAGDVIAAEDGLGRRWAVNRDADLLPREIELPGGRVIRYEGEPDHDEGRIGRLRSLTGPDGLTWNYDYDAYGHVSEVTDPQGGTTRLDYSRPGELETLLDAEGRVTRFEWAQGGLAAMHTPMGRTERWEYANDGTPLRWLRPGDVTIDYERVGNDLRVLLPGGEVLSSEAGIAGVTALRGGTGGDVELDRDAVGRVTRLRRDDGAELSIERTIGGQLASLTATLPNGASAQTLYRYDGRGRVVEIEAPGGGITRYTWDAGDRLERIERPNGSSSDYSWSPVGRPSLIEHRDANNALIARSEMSYTAEQLSWQRDEQGERLFSYDVLGRLSEERAVDATGDVLWRRTWRYDGVGNLIQEDGPEGLRQHRYDDDDRRLETVGPEGTTTYSYNARGGLTTIDGPEGVTQYSYDVLDRLERVDLPDGSFEAYRYDAWGRLLTREDASGERHCLLLPESLTGHSTCAAWYSAAGDEQWLVHGPTGLAATLESAGDRHFHAGHLNHIVASSAADGQAVASAQYAPFGRLRSSAGESLSHGFTGEPQSSATGLVYLRRRWYHPGLGRFLTPDLAPAPAADSRDHHRYVYGRNDPLNRVDPSGELSLVELNASFSVRSVLQFIGQAVKSCAGGAVRKQLGEGLASWAASQLFSNSAAVTKIQDMLSVVPTSKKKGRRPNENDFGRALYETGCGNASDVSPFQGFLEFEVNVTQCGRQNNNRNTIWKTSQDGKSKEKIALESPVAAYTDCFNGYRTHTGIDIVFAQILPIELKNTKKTSNPGQRDRYCRFGAVHGLHVTVYGFMEDPGETFVNKYATACWEVWKDTAGCKDEKRDAQNLGSLLAVVVVKSEQKSGGKGKKKIFRNGRVYFPSAKSPCGN